eukprot:Hpha_TRINITY_DN22417_c0_g1::TRINITY_DN22417_c0_g1_i1::g.95125::m.95125
MSHGDSGDSARMPRQISTSDNDHRSMTSASLAAAGGQRSPGAAPEQRSLTSTSLVQRSPGAPPGRNLGQRHSIPGGVTLETPRISPAPPRHDTISTGQTKAKRSVASSRRGASDRRRTVMGGINMRAVTSLLVGAGKMLTGVREQKRRAFKQPAEYNEIGVAQMISLVVSHILAPLWSVGVDTSDVPNTPIDWDSDRVKRLVNQLSPNGKWDPGLASYQAVQHILERHPDLTTAYIIMNVSLLEHLERLYIRDSGGGAPEGGPLISLEQVRLRLLEQASRMPTRGTQDRWNDEEYGDHKRRRLTDMGGKPLAELGGAMRVAKEHDLMQAGDDLSTTRICILESLLLASTFCRFNFRDGRLYFVCNELKEQMFLIAPNEELAGLCCGQKGPNYLSKYIRFLAHNTAVPLDDQRRPIAGCIPPSPAQTIPTVVQDAALPILLSLFNLAHSGSKAGEYIVMACANAIQGMLQDIEELEVRIAQIEVWTEAEAKAERQKSEEGEKKGLLPVVAGIRVPARFLTAVPRKLFEVAGDLGRKAGEALAVIERKEEEVPKPPDPRPLRNKVTGLKGVLPTLLCVIKLLLQRVHCYGSSESARAWGELIAAARPLMQCPMPTGRLASDVLRCATAAVQCMGSLARHRFSRCLVGGQDIEMFRRDTVRMLFAAQDGTAIKSVWLGRVNCCRPEGHWGPLLTLPVQKPPTEGQNVGLQDSFLRVRSFPDEGMVERTASGLKPAESFASGSSGGQPSQQLCDDLAAPASLVLSVLLRIADAEAEAANDKRTSSDPFVRSASEMRSVLLNTPAYVLARAFPTVYRLLRGPVGAAGTLLTFSEGSGQSLKVVPTLYKKLLAVYDSIQADKADGSIDTASLPPLALQPLRPQVSPSCPMLDIVARVVHPDHLEADLGASWCEALVAAAQEHWQCRQEGACTAVERLHPESGKKREQSAGLKCEIGKGAEWDDIRIALCGGIKTLMHFCNGLARYAQKVSADQLSEQSFKVYPLPVGGESMLCNFLDRHDPLYFQFVSWPLTRFQYPEGDPRSQEAWDEFTRRLADGKEAETCDAALLRSAVDMYCTDADKCHRVYVYKLEGWRPNKGQQQRSKQLLPLSPSDTRNLSSPAGDGKVSVAWCQQVELGPSTAAGDCYAGRVDGVGRSPRCGLAPSPSMGSFSHDEPLDFGSPPSTRNLRGVSLPPNQLSGPGGRIQSRAHSAPGRARSTSLRGSGHVQIGSGVSGKRVRVDELALMMHGHMEDVKGLEIKELPQEYRGAASFGCVCATGAGVIEWLLATFAHNLTVSPREDATVAAQRMVDTGILQTLSSAASGGDTTFQDTPTSWYRVRQSQEVDQEGIASPLPPSQRRHTVTSANPSHLRVSYQPLPGGRRYPELQDRRQPHDSWVHKLSVRNIGKEGDTGLRPDPTSPELQVYMLSHRNRTKKLFPGEGQHFTVHGSLTVEATSPTITSISSPTGKPQRSTQFGTTMQTPSEDGFRVWVDGTVMGPFTKIRLSPWLVSVPQRSEAAEQGWTHEHLNFHVMSFCPINKN